MAISEKIIKQMKERGFQPVSGAACVGDAVVVEMELPVPSARCLILKTLESTAVFNQECGSNWAVFRPVNSES